MSTIRTRHYRAGGDVIVEWAAQEDPALLAPLGMTLQHLGDRPLEDFLRDVAADPELVRHALDAYATLGAPFLSGRPEPVEQAPSGSGRPLRYGEDHLRMVVRDYRRLLALRHPTPVEFLADRCYVTRGTVGGWLRTARRRGWLAEDERVQR